MDQPNKNKKKTIEPKYTLINQANSARNNSMGLDTKRPATRKDSLDYKVGFNSAIRSQLTNKPVNTNGENEFSKMGRWEGQNTKVYSKMKK